MCGSSARKKRCPWRTGPNLIDDADALANLSFSHPVQRLQVELIGGLSRHDLHRRRQRHLIRSERRFVLFSMLCSSLAPLPASIGEHETRRFSIIEFRRHFSLCIAQGCRIAFKTK